MASSRLPETLRNPESRQTVKHSDARLFSQFRLENESSSNSSTAAPQKKITLIPNTVQRQSETWRISDITAYRQNVAKTLMEEETLSDIRKNNYFFIYLNRYIRYIFSIFYKNTFFLSSSEAWCQKKNGELNSKN